MKKIKVPNAFVIVFGIMIFSAILTYIIPAGRYELIEGSRVLDPNSFHYVERSGTTLWQFINSVNTGMKNGATIIFMIFLLGGYFHVLIETRAIDAFVNLLIDKFGNKALLILPIIMVLMSTLGAIGIMANPVVAFIPVGLVVARKLKLDQLCALAMTLVAAYCGFGVSPMCAATLQMAQKMADLPVMSGFIFRFVLWIILLTITIIYVMKYAAAITQDRKASIMKDECLIENEGLDVPCTFTFRHALVLFVLVLGLGIYIWGSMQFEWGTDYLIGIMFCVALISAVITGMSTDDFVRTALDGARQMTFSAMLVGFATAISVILTDGNIIHTIVYGMAQLLLLLPQIMVAPVMYILNIIINFFVSSGSGQAAVVMPIMAPLSDVVGVSRQMAVCAYQFGDGLSNLIFPTNGTMMACIAIAGVKFDRWLKWMLPLYGIWLIVTILAMMVGVWIGIT